jgi:hypothetical protein
MRKRVLEPLPAATFRVVRMNRRMALRQTFVLHIPPSRRSEESSSMRHEFSNSQPEFSGQIQLVVPQICNRT